MRRGLIASFTAALVFVGVSITPAFAARHADVDTLNGAGSTFVNPLFQKAFTVYHNNHPDVAVNYQAVGSGAGQTDLDQGTVDFGSFDVPMLASDGFTNFNNIVQFPVALGGVAIVAHLPNYSYPLKITGKLAALIYMGKILKWTDSRLENLNPHLNVMRGRPSNNITVVHRSDSSGTTYIFTDFLSHTSTGWASAYGASKLPAWPVGVGGSGNSGVAALVNQNTGSIGYLEMTYAYNNTDAGTSKAFVKNKAGSFLQPSLLGVHNDATQITGLSPTNFSIVFRPGTNSYPISGFVWTGMYQHPSDSTKCNDTVALFKWETTSGQSLAPAKDYPKLTTPAVNLATSQLNTVSC